MKNGTVSKPWTLPPQHNTPIKKNRKNTTVPGSKGNSSVSWGEKQQR